MAALIEMYRTSQANSWEEAEQDGATYVTFASIPEEALDIINTVASMMGDGQIETRVRDGYPDEFVRFTDSLNKATGFSVGVGDVYRIVRLHHPNVTVYDNEIVDAWMIWKDAVRFAKTTKGA